MRVLVWVTNIKIREQKWVNASSFTMDVRRIFKVLVLLLLIKKVRTTQIISYYHVNIFKLVDNFCCNIYHGIATSQNNNIPHLIF